MPQTCAKLLYLIVVERLQFKGLKPRFDIGRIIGEPVGVVLVARSENELSPAAVRLRSAKFAYLLKKQVGRCRGRDFVQAVKDDKAVPAAPQSLKVLVGKRGVLDAARDVFAKIAIDCLAAAPKVGTAHDDRQHLGGGGAPQLLDVLRLAHTGRTVHEQQVAARKQFLRGKLVDAATLHVALDVDLVIVNGRVALLPIDKEGQQAHLFLARLACGFVDLKGAPEQQIGDLGRKIFERLLRDFFAEKYGAVVVVCKQRLAVLTERLEIVNRLVWTKRHQSI